MHNIRRLSFSKIKKKINRRFDLSKPKANMSVVNSSNQKFNNQIDIHVNSILVKTPKFTLY